ncbi:hypothetical protein KBA27_04295 [bacterium]|nr:hypothetical protein [bacterium]
MKSYIYVLSALIIFSLTAQATTLSLPPLQPILTRQQQEKNNPVVPDYEKNFQQVNDDTQNTLSKLTPIVQDTTVNYPKINEIEQLIYGKKFSHQKLADRLSRIETNMYGKTYKDLPYSQRVDKIVNDFTGTSNKDLSSTTSSRDSMLSDNMISKMEQKVLGQSYPTEEEEKRVSRLEQRVLGASQSGDILSRFNKLSTVIRKASESQTASVAPPKNHGVKGFFSNFAQNFGAGSMTGFTPSLDNFDDNGFSSPNYGYNAYSPYNYNNFSSPQSGLYRGVRSNSGYLDQFKTYGSGSSVTILD